MTRLTHWGALLVVLGLAAFFRLHRLNTVPPGLFIDEAVNGFAAHEIGRERGFPVFIAADQLPPRSREPLFHYIAAATFAVFGPTVYSLRLAAALTGIGAVSLYYLACRPWLGLRTAFLAAGLLAVSRWHVTFSRAGMRAVTATLCAALVLLALGGLLRRRSFPAALFFGAALAFGFYSYPAYWVIPPAAAVLLLVAARRDHNRSARLYTKLTAAVALGGLVIIAPLLCYAVRRPEIVFARAVETVSPLAQRQGVSFQLRDNAQRVLFMLHFRGDAQARHNIPGKPQLDPLTGIAFLAGLYWLLRTLRRGKEVKLAALLFWLLPLLPSAATQDAPHAMRAVVATLGVCAISAMGFDLLSRAAERRPVLRAAGVPALLPVVLIAAAGAWSYHNYFRVWAKLPAVQRDFTGPLPAFFDFYAGLGGKNDIYVSPYVYYSPNLRFFTLARPVRQRLIDSPDALRADETPARDRVIISEFPALNFLIERLYPRVETITTYSVYGVSSGRVYKLRREQLRRRFSEEDEDLLKFTIERLLRQSEEQRKRW